MPKTRRNAAPGTNAMGADYYGGLLSDGWDMYGTIVDGLKDAAYADGRPPFTAKNDPLREFEQLTAMKGRGDPKFWGNIEAQQRYTALEHQYGTPAGPGPSVGASAGMTPYSDPGLLG